MLTLWCDCAAVLSGMDCVVSTKIESLTLIGMLRKGLSSD